MESSREFDFVLKWIELTTSNTIRPITFFSQLSEGLILCDFLSVIFPQIQFRGLHQKARTRKTCLDNIEQALAIVWKKRGSMKAKYVCSADEILKARLEERGEVPGKYFRKKVALFFIEMFGYFVVKEIRASSKHVLSWFNGYLGIFGWDFSEQTVKYPCEERGTLIREFVSLTRIGIMLCLFEDGVTLEESLLNIFGTPTESYQFLENAQFVLQRLEIMHFPVLVESRDFVDTTDISSERILIQLHAIWECAVVTRKITSLKSRDDVANFMLTIREQSGTTASLGQMTFKDGTPLIKLAAIDDEIYQDIMADNSGGRESTPAENDKSPLSPQRKISCVMEPVEVSIFLPRSTNPIKGTIIGRLLASENSQCSIQFWEKMDNLHSRPEPFFAFDVLSLVDVVPYEDSQLRKNAVLFVLHPWGVLRDLYFSNGLKENIISIRLVPSCDRNDLIDEVLRLRDVFFAGINS